VKKWFPVLAIAALLYFLSKKKAEAPASAPQIPAYGSPYSTPGVRIAPSAATAKPAGFDWGSLINQALRAISSREKPNQTGKLSQPGKGGGGGGGGGGSGSQKQPVTNADDPNNPDQGNDPGLPYDPYAVAGEFDQEPLDPFSLYDSQGNYIEQPIDSGAGGSAPDLSGEAGGGSAPDFLSGESGGGGSAPDFSGEFAGSGGDFSGGDFGGGFGGWDFGGDGGGDYVNSGP
jgi:hypothetical protein